MGNIPSGAGGSRRGSSSMPAREAQKTCYYELLSVERSATQEEIKKAYKKKALELHPDRNYNDVERATKLFAEVQAAYEVLSDPQERAWYDSHREAILHGQGPHEPESSFQTHSTTSAEVLSWFSLFPSKSKIDYSDGPTGFYSILSSTFSKLADEERSAADEQGLEEPFLPNFGGSKSEYSDHVRHFYKHWTGFRTVKSFSWYDAYRLSDAPDRRIRRAMDKENELFRREAKREFEDTVREFVQFVRKRDPRYVSQTPKTENERIAEILARSREQAARARAANAAAQKEYKPADWTKVAEDEELSEAGEKEDDEEVQEEKVVFECVACRKAFKTGGQMADHEKSKRHKQAIWRLRKKMEKENIELGLSMEDGMPETEDREEEGEQNAEVGQLHPENTDKPSEISPVEGASNSDDETKGKEEEGDGYDDVPTAKHHERVPCSSDAPRKGDSKGLVETPAEASLHPSDSDSQKPTIQPKIGKAKAKREKRAAAAAAAAATAASTQMCEHKCLSCHAQFMSKNEMFAHLKEYPSHAAPLTKKGKSATSSRNEKKLKGKGK